MQIVVQSDAWCTKLAPLRHFPTNSNGLLAPTTKRQEEFTAEISDWEMRKVQGQGNRSLSKASPPSAAVNIQLKRCMVAPVF